MREDEKIALRVTNESKTVIDALEGNARIEYKYKDEESFEEVFNESFAKGVIKTEDGKLPSPREGKEVEEVKVKITPSNYPFYSSREDSFAARRMRELIDKGKFELFSNVERSFAYRKEAAEESLTDKVDELKARKQVANS
tara:strand:+ start:899 stop:1321 length:423 start_codon:yes stop_codon:yes gene_type:complete